MHGTMNKYSIQPNRDPEAPCESQRLQKTAMTVSLLISVFCAHFVSFVLHLRGVCFWLAACVCDLLVVIHRSHCPSMAVYGMLVSAHAVACPCANARQSSVKQ